MGVAGLRYNWKCGEFIASAAGRPYPGPTRPSRRRPATLAGCCCSSRGQGREQGSASPTGLSPQRVVVDSLHAVQTLLHLKSLYMLIFNTYSVIVL